MKMRFTRLGDGRYLWRVGHGKLDRYLIERESAHVWHVYLFGLPTSTTVATMAEARSLVSRHFGVVAIEALAKAA